MQAKGPAQTTPSSLGRLQLKRVAVSKADGPAKPAGPRRRVIVAAAEKAVRDAIIALMPSERFECHGFADGDSAYDHYQGTGCELAVLSRKLPGLSGTVLCDLVRKSRKGATVALLLVGAEYTDPYLGAGDCNAFGADAFLALPASAELLHARVESALARREPIEKLGVMPKPLAQNLDQLFEAFDTLSYYALLDVPENAQKKQIQKAFHRRSMLLHPDRHTKLKGSHPHAWDKVNAVYKRISEAYKVLVDDSRRRSYNIGLRRGTLRFEPAKIGGREQREVGYCQTDQGRAKMLESLELRSLGDLEGALEATAEAVELEPGNTDLRQVYESLTKLVSIINRA